jgi:hypothetical protein
MTANTQQTVEVPVLHLVQYIDQTGSQFKGVGIRDPHEDTHTSSSNNVRFGDVTCLHQPPLALANDPESLLRVHGAKCHLPRTRSNGRPASGPLFGSGRLDVHALRGLSPCAPGAEKGVSSTSLRIRIRGSMSCLRPWFRRHHWAYRFCDVCFAVRRRRHPTTNPHLRSQSPWRHPRKRMDHRRRVGRQFQNSIPAMQKIHGSAPMGVAPPL